MTLQKLSSVLLASEAAGTALCGTTLTTIPGETIHIIYNHRLIPVCTILVQDHHY